ncbi:hypothetical protein [Deinococcus cavernae]|uniref:hypothetical protein n=1 Tax=Deinococcus cavernae TaxID=2320857 RepID=UPI0011C212F6|nr:hypothetical protein [Deinococcus cavernae]
MRLLALLFLFLPRPARVQNRFKPDDGRGPPAVTVGTPGRGLRGLWPLPPPSARSSGPNPGLPGVACGSIPRRSLPGDSWPARGR